jgi:hypothetical protein
MNSVMDHQPALYYFISYSRQEVTFVDSFSRELQKRSEWKARPLPSS